MAALLHTPVETGETMRATEYAEDERRRDDERRLDTEQHSEGGQHAGGDRCEDEVEHAVGERRCGVSRRLAAELRGECGHHAGGDERGGAGGYAGEGRVAERLRSSVSSNAARCAGGGHI